MLAPLSALVLATATSTVLVGPSASERPRPAHLQKGFDPSGWLFEITPSGSFCLPTAAVKCKTGDGKTGPFLGGHFQFGYRPLRHIAIGLAYSGAALRPSWSFDVLLDNEPRERSYKKFAQIHGVYAWGRPILGLGPVDLGAELGLGWAIQIFPLSTPADTTMIAQGFSMYFAPVFDVFVHPNVYIGIKGTFYVNPIIKLRVKGPDGTTKRNRVKNEDQFPVNQALVGVRVGVIF